tara:strand:+ start:2240 stop:2428 length:189 start_codon:yes stop_codon:yes gene_type:complete
LEIFPSFLGETAAVIAVLDFIYWASGYSPDWMIWIWIVFGVVFIADWMLGGVSDKGIYKKCF